MPTYTPPIEPIVIEVKDGMFDELTGDWTCEEWKQKMIIFNKQSQITYKLNELKYFVSQEVYVQLLNDMSELFNKANKYEVYQK